MQKKGIINKNCVNDCELGERSFLKPVRPLSATQALAGDARPANAVLK